MPRARREGDFSVRAAAAAAAATATRGGLTVARLRRGAVHREDGELAPGVRGAAVRARRCVGVHADELLKVLLALHAGVLVDGHARSLTAGGPRRGGRGGGILPMPRIPPGTGAQQKRSNT